MENKLKLSEIIKTDCYIDCGSNEKLRGVVKKVKLPKSTTQINFGITKSDSYILFYRHTYTTYTFSNTFDLPIHHISEIDLNN